MSDTDSPDSKGDSQGNDAYPNHMVPSWEDIADLSERLADKLKPFSSADAALVAITRGGLIPAALVARHLGIRYIDTVGLASYDGKAQSDIQLIKALSPLQKRIDENGANLLIIDDLVDTGKTGDFLRKMYPKARLGTLYAKTHGLSHADVYVEEIPSDTWIDFPWEKIGED